MTEIQIEPHDGSRAALMTFFRLADESETHIRSYYELGHVLVARDDGTTVGMVQIARDTTTIEIVSLAVTPARQRQGIGTRLIHEAENYCRAHAIGQLTVSTGIWETDNIAFYLRRGFRVANVARDFFTAEKGYELPLRDQVQFEKFL